jgi:cytochrome c
VFLELDAMKNEHVVYIKIGRGLGSPNDETLWTTEAWYTLNRIPTPVHPVQPVGRPINALTARERAEGFRMLFDGKSLTGFGGWKKSSTPKGWQVQNGELRFVPGVEAGDIRTSEQFGNFELRLEWQVQKGGNSGIMYRSTEDHDYPWETGPEMQVLDDDLHPDGRSTLTSAGSCYGLYARSRDVARPAGEWNEARLVIRGSHVEHWLNGYKIVEYELGSQAWKDLVSKSKFASMPDYGKREKGFIVLQDHGDPVAFRSIRIRKL